MKQAEKPQGSVSWVFVGTIYNAVVSRTSRSGVVNYEPESVEPKQILTDIVKNSYLKDVPEFKK